MPAWLLMAILAGLIAKPPTRGITGEPPESPDARVVFVADVGAGSIAAEGEHAAWGDLDQDGRVDLWAGGVLSLQRPRGEFARIDAPGQGVIADLDNDGVGDLVSFSPIEVRRGRRDESAPGGYRFEPVPLPALPATVSRGVSVADLDGDGRLDLAFGGYEDWERDLTYPNLILRNARTESGELAFEIHSEATLYRTRGITACDFDEDGDLDLYRSNYRLQPNELLVNDGRGSLADDALARGAVATSEGFGGGHSIGACFGDFDADGHFDLFAGNFAHVDSRGDQPKSRFLRNRGSEAGFTFEDLGPCGIHYQESYATPAAADVDNDGRLDLYFTTVYAIASFETPNHPVLFRNELESGAWQVRDITAGSGLESLPPTYQAAFADVDRDGRIDLVTAGRLFLNRSPAAGAALEVRLLGDGLRVNRDAVGAQVRATLGDGRVLTRQVELGTGEGNCNSPFLHFGLGPATGPLHVEVRWPDGTRTELAEVAPDSAIDLAYGGEPTIRPLRALAGVDLSE